MSAAPQPASAWTEPPWSGWIETTGDALLILEAARRGLIPRVTRRLVDSERKMICSGSVFVFDEDESGIKRWTDGFFWSPSRILGNFLLYRETDKRGAGHRGVKSESSSDINEQQYADSVKLEGSLSRPKADEAHIGGADKQRERTLMGSLTNSYKFKSDGLMKKTFSLTIGGVSQHLISYYKIEDVQNGRLRSPSSLPELASLDISPEYLDKTHFRNPPKVEIGVDGIPRYRGEADDIDSSPSLLATPLSGGPPLLTDGRIADASNISRRGKQRFEPYSATAGTKRPRRLTKSGEPVTPPEQPAVPPAPTPAPAPAANYSEPPTPMAATAAPHYPPPYGTPFAGSPAYYPIPGYPGVAPPIQAQPQVYYSPPAGTAPPQHAPPVGPVPFQYTYPAPHAPTPPPAAQQQSSPETVQQQQSQQVQALPPPQAYYAYPPQQHSPYAGAWPPYGYPSMPPHAMPHMHQQQSSIANAPVHTPAVLSGENTGG
ncbi:hypothetical protein H0H87_007357 [Tephrocybe sp. NHM501043]|nr:hypothetical protein H0H87_007357 [Tephrocybe sp. NHM501043]